MSGQGAIARSEIQADRNKIKARRNKIQAGGDKIQIRRNKIQMPVPSANRGFSIGYQGLWTICQLPPTQRRSIRF
jgi:hypothetical protein